MTTELTSVELEHHPSISRQDADSDTQDRSSVEPGLHTIDQALARVDGGSSAWTLLCAAFVFEGILWGFPLSFGIFQSYYSQLPQFNNSPYITYVGTIATGITYLGAPFVAPFVKRFPRYQRPMIWLGWVLCIGSLVAGSFADTVSSLIATQGVIYGVGYLIIFYPIISMMNEWWVARRGFAWGIMVGSSGASGVAYPFIIETLLQRYGYKMTLRALAVATAVLTGPLLPLFKGRLPASHSSALARTDWSFLKKPLFWLYAISTTAQSLGFYLPSLYLPSYALSVGLSFRTGAMLVALMSAAQVLGQLTYGYLSDGRLSLNILMLSTCIVAAVSSLTLWGLAKSVAPLVLFALVYGFFAYAYMAMRVRMGTAVTSNQSSALAIFCVFSFLQGIGNILAGPISGSLLSPVVDSHEYGYVRYKVLVIFTACSMVVSAASITLSSCLRRFIVVA
ncbi:Major facilitator superfamily transporter protein [Rutstroemia sp. NJR-2017a BBW]|nr:Major facilitator superfamily transporter protein [Rutstroemia sp. NJR-2017a BBW]